MPSATASYNGDLETAKRQLFEHEMRSQVSGITELPCLRPTSFRSSHHRKTSDRTKLDCPEPIAAKPHHFCWLPHVALPKISTDN